MYKSRQILKMVTTHTVVIVITWRIIDYDPLYFESRSFLVIKIIN